MVELGKRSADAALRPKVSDGSEWRDGCMGEGCGAADVTRTDVRSTDRVRCREFKLEVQRPVKEGESVPQRNWFKGEHWRKRCADELPAIKCRRTVFDRGVTPSLAEPTGDRADPWTASFDNLAGDAAQRRPV